MSEDATIEVLASGVISGGIDTTAPIEADAAASVLVRRGLAGFSKRCQTRPPQNLA